MSVTQAQTILSKIRERGYWRVVIRPTSFEEKHIPEYSELFRIVERNAVRCAGGITHTLITNPSLKEGTTGLGKSSNGKTSSRSGGCTRAGSSFTISP